MKGGGGISTIASLMVNIGANIGDFKQGTNEVKGTLRSLASDVAAISATAFAGITAAMVPISAYALKLSSNMQQARISMETMLGSAEKADSMIGDLWKFAAETPFEFTDLQMATKRMLAFGFAAEDVIPDLTAVGDAAAGLGVGSDGVNRITLALGQMKAKGKVSGDEMLQMTEAGIPAWDILSKSIGKSTAEVMELAEKGVIPADQAIQALLVGMEEKFPNMMDKQSKSMEGLFSTLKDNISTVLIEVFKPAVTWLTDVGLPKLIEMTSNFANTMKNGGSLSEAISSMFSGGFDGVLSQMGTVGEYLQRIGNAIAWVKDNANLLVPVLIELVSALIALQIIQSVLGPLEAFVVVGIVVVGIISAMAAAAGNMAAVAAIAPILAGLITVLEGLAMTSLIIGGVVLAIGALAAAAYLVYDNWEPIKTWFINLWNEVVSFVSDNILVLCALFPVLGAAAYVIYEYWGEAVDLANNIMNSLVEFSIWAKDAIINEFSYYAKMWDDFVAWAVQGIANFKAELADLVSSFMPAWAGAMLGGIQSLGDKLAAKTAEIGAAMRKNLTVVPKNFDTDTGGAIYGPENNPDIATITPATITPPATIRPADWSKVDFTGGKGDKKQGKSDEEKAAEKEAKAYEKLQDQAEKTSQSIKDEWISLTATKTDALDNWYDKELKDLNASASANSEYALDLGRLNEIYASKHSKILADQQKETNVVWDSAISDVTDYQNKLAELNMGSGTKQVFEIKSNAVEEITKIKNSARDLEENFGQLTNEIKLQTIEAWTASGKQFTVTKDGMAIDAQDLAKQVLTNTANMSNTQISLAQDVANKTVVVNKEMADKLKKVNEDLLNYEETLSNAKKDGNLPAYIAELNSERGALSQNLAGNQEMIDAYYSTWKETHRTSMSYMAEGMTSFQSGLTGIFEDIGKNINSAGDLIKSFGSMVISTIVKMQAQAAAASITSSLFGGLLGGITSNTGQFTNSNNQILSGPVRSNGKFASGGQIFGAGTGTSDSIMAMVSNGEYIIQDSAVKQFGSGFFDMLNAGKMPAFATGGIVTGSPLSSIGGSRYANAISEPVVRQSSNNSNSNSNNKTTPQIIMNIHTNDAQSFRKSQNQILGEANMAMMRGRRNI